MEKGPELGKGQTPPTLKTVSEALGVSKTAVSLVLKGDGDKYRISSETQNRIIGYAESVGFQPDFFAKALVTKKTSTIGLVFPDVHETFMSEMVKGIETVLYGKDYSMILSTSGFSSEIELRNIKELIHRKVDGIIIVPYVPIGADSYNHGYLKLIKKADCPVVFADRIPPENNELNWIIQDDYDSAFNAVKELHKNGCRRIKALSFNLHTSSITERIRGFLDGLSACGLEAGPDELMLLDVQDKNSNDLFEKLLSMEKNNENIDGLLVTTGGLALKTRYLIKKHFPKFNDLKIVKFGRDPEYCATGMVQIEQPNIEMGQRAAEALLGLISGETEPPVQNEIKSRILNLEE